MDSYFADVGPFYDSLGARRHLGGVSDPSLRALVASGDVLELQTGHGAYVYPAWQFTGRSVHPELLPALHALQGLDGWLAAAWLSSPHPDLEGRSPREALREGVEAWLVAGIARRDGLAQEHRAGWPTDHHPDAPQGGLGSPASSRATSPTNADGRPAPSDRG